MDSFIHWLEYRLEEQADKIVRIVLENNLDGYAVIEQYDDPSDFLRSAKFQKQVSEPEDPRTFLGKPLHKAMPQHTVKDMPQPKISFPRGGSMRGSDAARSVSSTVDAIRNTLAQQQKLDAHLGSATRQLDRLRQTHKSLGLDQAVETMIKTRSLLQGTFTKAFKDKMNKAYAGLTAIRDELSGAHQYSTRKVPHGYRPELGSPPPEPPPPQELQDYERAMRLKEKFGPNVDDWLNNKGKPYAERTKKKYKAILEKGRPRQPHEIPFDELSPEDQRKYMMTIGLPGMPGGLAGRIQRHGASGKYLQDDQEFEPGSFEPEPEAPKVGDTFMSGEREAEAKKTAEQLAQGIPPGDYTPEELTDALRASTNPEVRKAVQDAIDKFSKEHYGTGILGFLRRFASGTVGKLPDGYGVEMR